MRPKRLTMQAFGSYGKREVIDFEKTNQNLFLITGDTGAGKSTIFDAIVFALYGEASSGANRKNGTELQSQYVGYDTQPFVELVFSEGNEVYTVRRIPRHVRPLKRGSGVKEESETVSLILPDGMEYPQKETDKKLEEITGLTKSQFMQVAMIAQGEFMELLRARSDDKKVIFRKLFHTELYQKIVEELAGRRREKQQEISQIRTVCQTEVSHIVIPEEICGEETGEEGTENGGSGQAKDAAAETLGQLKKRILSSERFSVVDMERLLEMLKSLCETLKKRCEQAEEEHDSANRDHLAKRDAYTNAQQLLGRFEELERARKDLAECAEEETEIQEAEKLAAQIDAAYEIRAVWERYTDAARAVSDVKRRLGEQQDALPELKRACEAAESLSGTAEERLNRELQVFSKVSERVKKALGILEKIRKAETDIDRGTKVCKKAQLAETAARKELERLENMEQEWRGQAERLNGVHALLVHWKAKRSRADEMAADLETVKALQQNTVSHREAAEKAALRFGEASDAYERKQAEYEKARRIFLNTQAGFLAKEQLRPGRPCPVCGSLDHPHPCELEDEHRGLDRESLDALGEEAANLRDRQEKAAADARSAADLLAERERNLAEEAEKLAGKLSEYVPDRNFSGDNGRMAEKSFLFRAEEALVAWNCSLKEEGLRLRKELQKLEELQKLLERAEQKKQELKAASEQAGREAAEAKAALAGCQATLESLEASRDYQTEAEARDAFREAKERRERAEKELKTAKALEQKKRSEKETAETLIRQYQKNLPGQEAEYAQRKSGYEAVMAEKELPEADWQSLTEHYGRSETAVLRGRISAHVRKKAAAERMQAAEQAAIGGQKRPDLAELREAKEAAEERYRMSRASFDEVREQYRRNEGVYRALAPKMEERGRVMAEQKRLDDLYSLLSGNVTGGRMDIETYVQRYYLEQILYAANRRFQEMSAGQFELRMCSQEQAGAGKNRGLDLMVYSAVTGKEREVRTLSGGESFMAALSLALGMADLIQAGAASVNLDMMFIDEGFGSLDDHSREKAVRVLQEMAGGSKLIGIISHVTELKQEIEDQLIVTKDKGGSHAVWQIS